MNFQRFHNQLANPISINTKETTKPSFPSLQQEQKPNYQPNADQLLAMRLQSLKEKQDIYNKFYTPFASVLDYQNLFANIDMSSQGVSQINAPQTMQGLIVAQKEKIATDAEVKSQLFELIKNTVARDGTYD